MSGYGHLTLQKRGDVGICCILMRFYIHMQCKCMLGRGLRERMQVQITLQLLQLLKKA